MTVEVHKPWHVERPEEKIAGFVAEYGRPGETDWRRVAVDPDAGTVTFFRCLRRDSFWCWGPDAEYTCAVRDVVAVRQNRVRGIGRVIEIVTPRGLARLPHSATGFAAVHDALVAVAPVTRPRWYQLDLVVTFLLLLVVFPVGFLATLLVANAAQKQWLPQWLLFGPLFAVMIFVVVFPFVTWWRRKSMW